MRRLSLAVLLLLYSCGEADLPSVEPPPAVDVLLCANVVCPANATCQSSTGNCSCDEGYQDSGNGTCEYMSGSSCDNVACPANATCQPSTGNCACDEGYQDPGNGTCEALLVSLCADTMCSGNKTCEPSTGQCVCGEGYRDDGQGGCAFISPCENVTCPEYSTCTEASGLCACDEGYRSDDQGGCEYISVCEGITCQEHASCQEDSGMCACEDGYEEDTEGACVYVSLCEDVVCDEHAVCLEETGICGCKNGYRENDQGTCEFIPLCENVVCADNATCQEDTGICACREGYRDDGQGGCEWISLCENIICTEHATCLEDTGACVCDEGYRVDGQGGCEYIPFCENVSCQEHATCQEETRLCTCDEGYQADGFGRCVFVPRDACDAVLNVLCSTFEEAYIKASNTGRNDEFGWILSMDKGTLVVGVPEEDSSATGINGDQTDNSASSSGAVYVFVREGGVWTQQAYIKAPLVDAGDYFGYSVSVSGDTLAIGAYGEDSASTGIGGNKFNNSKRDSGAVYIYTRTHTTWTEQAYIKASNTGGGDHFGVSVAVDGNTLAVGANREDSSGINGDQADEVTYDSGAVYIFVRTNNGWAQEAYIKASNPDRYDYFGKVLALDGDTLAVGVPDEDSSATGVNGEDDDNGALDSGAVYVFVRSSGAWSQQAYIKASNTDAYDDFGRSIDLKGDVLAVGAPDEDSLAVGVNSQQSDNFATDSGAAYLYVRSNNTWVQSAYIKPSNTDAYNLFGRSVALDDDALVVGAPQEGSSAKGLNGDQSDRSLYYSGAAYMFVQENGQWVQRAYIKASNPDRSDYFGYVVMDEGILAIGAHGEDGSSVGINGHEHKNDVSSSGAVYIRRISAP